MLGSSGNHRTWTTLLCAGPRAASRDGGPRQGEITVALGVGAARGVGGGRRAGAPGCPAFACYLLWRRRHVNTIIASRACRFSPAWALFGIMSSCERFGVNQGIRSSRQRRPQLVVVEARRGAHERSRHREQGNGRLSRGCAAEGSMGDVGVLPLIFDNTVFNTSGSRAVTPPRTGGFYGLEWSTRDESRKASWRCGIRGLQGCAVLDSTEEARVEQS